MIRPILLILAALSLAGCGAVPLDPYPTGSANSAGAGNPVIQGENCTSALNCGNLSD